MHIKKILLLFIFSIGFLFSSGGEVPKMNFDELEDYLYRENDTTYVINFWATWCKPCIKEMPAFENVHKNFSNQKVKVILVSLDLPSQVNSKLIPFIEKHELKPLVILLDDPDANKWINKVDKSWSGAIPATLIYNYQKDYRKFHEGSIEQEELETYLNHN